MLNYRRVCILPRCPSVIPDICVGKGHPLFFERSYGESPFEISKSSLTASKDGLFSKVAIAMLNDQKVICLITLQIEVALSNINKGSWQAAPSHSNPTCHVTAVKNDGQYFSNAAWAAVLVLQKIQIGLQPANMAKTCGAQKRVLVDLQSHAIIDISTTIPSRIPVT